MFEGWEEEEEEQTEPEIHREPEIIAIGGGKGGIGKTVISASLGVGLAMLRKHVVLVDGDLGGADLHRVIGLDKPARTILDFLKKKYDSMQDILLDVPGIDHLKIACGADGSLGMANLPFLQKQKLMRHMRRLNADVILMDLGAGTSFQILDFFLAADKGIVVVKPDPLSILESYNFLKLAVFRQIARLIRRHEDAKRLIEEISLIETHRNSMTVSDLMNEIRKLDGELTLEIEQFLDAFKPYILINMKSSDKDEQNVLGIRTAVGELLSVNAVYLGAIARDDAVNEALIQMQPFILHDPGSIASKQMMEVIVNRLLDRRWIEAVLEKRSIKKRLGRIEGDERKVIMCSIRCMYWEDCDFKEGGFPCALQHFRGIEGFYEV